MWAKLKKFVSEAIYWIVIIGVLALLHVVDSNVVEVPDGLRQMTDEIPRQIYPIWYGLLGLFIMRHIRIKFANPKKMVRLFVAMFLILFASAKFADLPMIGILNTQYAAIFLALILVGLALACQDQISEAEDEILRSSLEAEALEGEVADTALRKGLSWLWHRNDDARNRALAKTVMPLIILIFLMSGGISVYVGWPRQDNPILPNAHWMLGIGIFLVLTFWAIAHMNAKQWAPNIDADRKLRKAFGAKYDGLLDEQLETKRLSTLLHEDWFVRVHAEMTSGKAAD